MNLALVNHKNHFISLRKNQENSKNMYIGSPKLKKLIGTSNMGGFSKSFDNATRNPVQFETNNSAHTPRVPEIQMINKLYGLVPKKFIISERVRPETAAAAVHIRSRSRVRPTTASKLKYTKSGHRILINSRQGNLDSSKSTGDNLSHSEDDLIAIAPGFRLKGGSFSASSTPLITRRMSFEKSYLRSFRQAKHVTGVSCSQMQSEQEEKSATQRVIHIDLNRMRWTEDDGNNSGDEVKPEVESGEKEKPDEPEDIKASSSKRRKSVRKTISFDEDALRAEKKEDKTKDEKKSKRPVTAKHASQKMANDTIADKTTMVEAKISVPASSAADVILSMSTAMPTTCAATTEDTPPVPWTAGKTTAERRAKFQKSFSIHPSMESSFESCLGFGVESESEATPYPSSMKRTGRKSLHVESPNDDIDTLLSTAKKKDRSSEQDSQYISNKGEFFNSASSVGSNIGNFSRSMSTLPAATESPTSSSSISKFPSASSLRQAEISCNNKLQADFATKSAEERRVCLRKSLSLPEGNGMKANTNANAKNNGKSGSRRPPLIRSTSLQPHGRNESHVSSAKSKPANANKPVIKKPILDMSQTRLRPRTAPSNHSRSTKSSKVDGADNNKRSGSQNNNGVSSSSSGRQPLKALQLPVSNVIQRQSSKEGGGDGDPERSQKLQGYERKVARSDSLGSKAASGMDVRKVVSWEKKVADNDKSDAKQDNDCEPEPPKKHSFRTLKNLPSYFKLLQQPRRRSISVDDDSLLKFTTASVAVATKVRATEEQNNSSAIVVVVPDGTDATRVQTMAESSGISVSAISTIKNIKKREECLKIYDKMTKVGCNVRLQTIFRGMMSPVEYREFITAAEASVQRQAKIDEAQSKESDAVSAVEGASGSYSNTANEMDKLVESSDLHSIAIA